MKKRVISVRRDIAVELCVPGNNPWRDIIFPTTWLHINAPKLWPLKSSTAMSRRTEITLFFMIFSELSPLSTTILEYNRMKGITYACYIAVVLRSQSHYMRGAKEETAGNSFFGVWELRKLRSPTFFSLCFSCPSAPAGQAGADRPERNINGWKRVNNCSNKD